MMTANPHFQRILTSLLLLPLLGWAVVSGDPVLSIALTLVAGLGLNEFYAMFWPGQEKPIWKAGGLVLAVAIIWAPLSWSNGALACIAFLCAALAFLGMYSQEKEDAFWDSQILLFGVLYLPFLLRLFRTFDMAEIAFVLLSTFATDTGAYYAGCYLGKRKIWPSISPKKTWAGSIGGFVGCIVLCTLFGAVYGKTGILSFALLGAAINIAAQFGDFFESALKRWRDIKDSGKILPGHGGILDRIDSLLFVTPLYTGLDALFHFFGS